MSVARDNIAQLLAPQTVAIVGASADPGRIGGRPVHYYRQAQFAGRLYPINPNRTEIQGYRAYASIDELPESIDVAVLAIPAAQVTAALEQCARKGAKAAIVFSAGFAETGGAGVTLQRELAEAAARLGIRVLGPNCLGLFNVRARHFPTFSSFPESGVPLPGRVGLVTQSGAYGTHVLMQARARRVGVNIWASTGNEADIDVAELVEAMARDDDTDVIACYLEGVRNGPAFLRALAAAHAARKPVIIMKVGRSHVGAQAAQSHTASLAGSDATFDAALKPYGVERVRTTEAMLDLAYAAGKAKLPRGNRLGIVTISGGAGVLMADTAEQEGLEVPAMPADVQSRLLASNPLGSPRNPVDVTGQALNDFSLVSEHLAALLEQDYDCIATFFTSWPGSNVIGPKLRTALREGTRLLGVRPMAVVMLAPPEVQQSYEHDGFLVFEDPSRAIAALAAMARVFARLKAEPERRAAPLPATVELLPDRPLSEAQLKRLLASAGIPVMPERLVRSAEAAGAAATELGCPVAMKIASPDITRKSEIGAVALGVASADEASRTFAHIVAAARTMAPEARIDGVLIAPMAGDGVEIIIGARHDPVFGPVIMAGIGGIFVEVLKDVALRLGAVDAEEARRMLQELKGFPLLAGARGRPAADIDAAARAIAALSSYALANAGRFAAIEINPLLVRPAGRGVVALDALLQLPARTTQAT
jgi:acetate---CoA ligase (ADP-forming)